jgi:hypothetical protein
MRMHHWLALAIITQVVLAQEQPAPVLTFINKQRYAIAVLDEVGNWVAIPAKKSREVRRGIQDKEEIGVGSIDAATQNFVAQWTLKFDLENIKNNFALLKRVTLTNRDTLTIEGKLKSTELVNEDVYLEYIRQHCTQQGCSWQRADDPAASSNTKPAARLVIVSNIRPRDVKGEMRPVHSRRSEDVEREEIATGKKNY